MIEIRFDWMLIKFSECTYENWPRTTKCVLCGTARGQTLKSSRNDEESRDDDVTRTSADHHLRRETPSPQGASYSKPISSLNTVDSKPGKWHFILREHVLK
jgi:hypothetical protein